MVQELRPQLSWCVALAAHVVVFVLAVGYVAPPIRAQATAESQPGDSTEATPADSGAAAPESGEATAPPCPDLPVDPAWKRLSADQNIWIDTTKKLVIVGGVVCHREGPLEMFACPRNTKEYESVVAVDCEAYMVHAALLAIGAKPGSPVSFQPEYQAATGPIVDIEVHWQVAGQDQNRVNKKTKAQNWVKHLPTGNPMPYEWVFAGSGFWTDESTKKEYYYAEGGELICVSNFSTATLDLPVRSSQQNADLMFGAFTENIPALGTKVHLHLRPRVKSKAPAGNLQSVEKPEKPN